VCMQPSRHCGKRRVTCTVLAGLAALCMVCTEVAWSEELPREDADRIWEMIGRLKEVLPPRSDEVHPASPTVYVRFDPPSITVPYWEESVRLSIEVSGVRNLEWFFVEMEFGSGLSLPEDGFVSAGPLWTGFGTPERDSEVPLPFGFRVDGSAIIWGFSPRRAITGDGTLAVIEFSIRDAGSTTVKMARFLWTEAGEAEIMRQAEILGSAQVEVVYQKPGAYLSFLPPGSGEPPPESPSRIQVPPDSAFPVYVCVEGLAGVTGLSFSVGFDQSGLDLVGIREGQLLRSAGRSLCCFDTAGRINAAGELMNQGIALLDPGPGIRGGGCVAELFFLARGTPSATIQLRDIAAVDPDAEPRREEIEVRDLDTPLTVTRSR
jgi:hypothetical protein